MLPSEALCNTYIKLIDIYTQMNRYSFSKIFIYFFELYLTVKSYVNREKLTCFRKIALKWQKIKKRHLVFFAQIIDNCKK